MFTLPVHGISGMICDTGNICHAFMALVHISRTIEINTYEAVLTIPSYLTSARRVFFWRPMMLGLPKPMNEAKPMIDFK